MFHLFLPLNKQSLVLVSFKHILFAKSTKMYKIIYKYISEFLCKMDKNESNAYNVLLQDDSQN